MDSLSKVTHEEKTDFEKLVQAQQYIKHLKIEEGKSASYIMELEEENKSLKDYLKSLPSEPIPCEPTIIYVDKASNKETNRKIQANYNKLLANHNALKREFKIYKEQTLQTIIKLQLNKKDGE
jgi:hypothetical protein